MPWTAVAPDHRTVVTASTHRGKSCVTVDTRSDGCFDALALRTVAFGERGAHVAYAARMRDRWVMVHDGRAGGSWEGVGAPRLSPDGVRLAYPALDNGKWRVVVDSTPGQPFDAILSGTLTFDSIGRHVAYAASRGDSVVVVVDDVASRGWSGVRQLTLSGEHVSYIARLGTRSRVVVDGWDGPEHREIVAIAPDAAASHVAYVVADENRRRVVVEGVPAAAAFDSIRSLVYPRGAVASFIARRGGRETIVRGEQVAEWHDAIESMAASPDGRWGYIARDGDSTSIIIDGARVAREAMAMDLVFGNAKRRAYIVADSVRSTVVDEHERYVFDFVVAGTLQFVRGGTAWACLVGDRTRRELFVVVNGERIGQPFDWSEVARRMQQDGAVKAIRAWIVAEAER